MISSRKPVEIPVRPWFKDHCFNGKVILPAVEIMEILASAVGPVHPASRPRIMGKATFSKFLEIPEGATELSALIEYDEGNEGEICARLLSQIRFKKITRIKEHAQMIFPAHLSEVPGAGSPDLSLTMRSDNPLKAEQIYKELVPFGPAYHTLTGQLHLSDKGAWGTLQAPSWADVQEGRKALGSPFPLDGAMHAACVFGQSITGFIPFPVGFARRTIHIPTEGGRQYHTEIILVSQGENELVFDLSLFDARGTICEAVKELRMRDVSGGQIKPPAWITGKHF